MSFIVHLNGYPGTGKKTIAIELEKLFNGKVLDNHSILNAAAAEHRRGSPSYFAAARNLRHQAYGEMEKLLPEIPFVMTNFITNEVSAHREIFNDAMQAAEHCHVTLFPVLLECAPGENARRACSPGRSQQQKLTSVEGLETMRDNYTMYRPPLSDTLDVTDLSPQKAALAIANMIQDRLKKLTGIPGLKIF